METYSLIVKGSGLGSDPRGFIYGKTKVYPESVTVTSHTKGEIIYQVKIQGGMDFESKLVNWFCDEPRDPPFPDQTLLFYTRVVKGE